MQTMKLEFQLWFQNSFLFNFLFSIGVQLINDIDSFRCTAKLFSYTFSHLGCYITLSRVPCAIYSRSLLVIHLKYSSACTSTQTLYPFSYPYLLVTIELLFLTTIPYCFQRLANDHDSDPDSHVSFFSFFFFFIFSFIF